MTSIKISFRISPKQLLLAIKIFKRLKPNFNSVKSSQIVKMCFEDFLADNATLTEHQSTNSAKLSASDQQLLDEFLNISSKTITTLDEFISLKDS